MDEHAYKEEVKKFDFTSLYRSGFVSSLILTITFIILWPIVTQCVPPNIGFIAVFISILTAFLFWRRRRQLVSNKRVDKEGEKVKVVK